MEQHEKQFEEFLQSFTPQRPRALPATHPSWRRVAAAAIVAVTLGTSLWFAVSKRDPNQPYYAATQNPPQPSQRPAATKPPSAIVLTQLALDHPERFEFALEEASRDSLPDFRRTESTLRVLAKE